MMNLFKFTPLLLALLFAGQQAWGAEDNATYHDNGQIASNEMYRAGTHNQVRVSVTYDEEGRKLSWFERLYDGQILVGKNYGYHNNGVLATLDIYKSNGYKTETFDENGKKLSVRTFSRGNVLLSGKDFTYHKNGQLASKTSYRSGRKNQVHNRTTYDENGRQLSYYLYSLKNVKDSLTLYPSGVR